MDQSKHSQAPRHDDRFGLNILALDGGGIYGLTEALLLKKLCRSCEWFLDGEDQPIFAGCSAGALNALLLAKETCPREAVLSGKLEAFWKEFGTFSYPTPVRTYFSYFGMTPWFSETAFTSLLQKYFGDMTLESLKHVVIVTAYSWTGRKPDFSRSSRAATLPWPYSVFAAAAEAMGEKQEEGANWGPICFHNIQHPKSAVGGPVSGPRLPSDDHGMPVLPILMSDGSTPHLYSADDQKVVDVAYAAASPPGLRRVRAGIGDGGAFNANPAMTALALVQGLRPYVKQADRFKESIHTEVRERGGEKGDVRRVKEAFDDISGGKNFWRLDDVAVLSIGAGQAQPAYWLRDIDLGSSAFQALPTNPLTSVFYPPSTYGLDPAADDADMMGTNMLGQNFHRLNPPVMATPTLVAVAMSRSPLFRQQFIWQIEQRIEGDEVKKHVRDTQAFLHERWKLPKEREVYLRDLATAANTKALKEGQRAIFRLIENSRGTLKHLMEEFDKFFIEHVKVLIADPFVTPVWTGNNPTSQSPTQIGSQKLPPSVDALSILEKSRTLVDRAIQIVLLGMANSVQASLNTWRKHEELYPVLADKFNVTSLQVERLVHLLPALLMSFYSDDPKTVIEYLRLASQYAEKARGPEGDAMLALLRSLQERRDRVSLEPHDFLFCPPKLPDAFSDEAVQKEIDVLEKRLASSINTGPRA